MARHARWPARWLAGLAASLACATGAAPTPAPDLAAAIARVRIVADAADLSGEIAVADRDGAQAGFVRGLADREAGRPHRPGERWLWASVTKQVAAVLVMQQVEAGTMRLDGTIRAYLPGFAGATGDRITVRQLLQHSSGLPNPDDTPAGEGEAPAFYRETGRGIGRETGRGIGDTARAHGFCAAPPRAAPGAGFAYDNCDYLVLGAMLERVTGRPFARLVAERIARPLGLRSLRMARDGAARGGAPAVGYAGPGRAPPLNVATFGASGALTGTARDLLAFDRALMGGALLRPATRALLWQGDPALGFEALGAWSFSATLEGCAAPVALVERRGDVGGIQVRNVLAPALGRAIVVFANDDAIDFGEVWQGRGLAHELLSAAFCPPVGPAVSPPGG